MARKKQIVAILTGLRVGKTTATEQTDLRDLFAFHPAPWRRSKPDRVGDFDIVDSMGGCVMSVSGEEEADGYGRGLVAAINVAARVYFP